MNVAWTVMLTIASYCNDIHVMLVAIITTPNKSRRHVWCEVCRGRLWHHVRCITPSRFGVSGFARAYSREASALTPWLAPSTTTADSHLRQGTPTPANGSAASPLLRAFLNLPCRMTNHQANAALVGMIGILTTTICR